MTNLVLSLIVMSNTCNVGWSGSNHVTGSRWFLAAELCASARVALSGGTNGGHYRMQLNANPVNTHDWYWFGPTITLPMNTNPIISLPKSNGNVWAFRAASVP